MAAWPLPAPWNSVENELVRWKKSSTRRCPTDAISSHVSVM